MAKGMIKANPEMQAQIDDANAAAHEMNRAEHEPTFSSDSDLSGEY
jgi:hypothetical protein